MNMTQLHCSGCGAQITPDWEKETAACAYCGNVYVLEKGNLCQNSGKTEKKANELPESPNPEYISWKDSGLEDHIMDWQDAALKGLEHLESLNIQQTKIEDLTPVMNLENLKSIMK